MIIKISKLTNIGKFSSIEQKHDFQYGGKNQNCNIVFGFNGSGKTTLSNAISFFADNSFIDEEEKKEIYDDIRNGDDAIAELSLQGGSIIKYPASQPHSKDFYIFNSNFVVTHVFNGTQGKIKKFSNIGGEIKNEKITDINDQIIQLEKEKKELEAENTKLDEEHKKITKNRSKSFGETLTDKNKKLQTKDLNKAQLPNDTIENLETELAALSTNYELSKKQEDINSDLTELRELAFDSLPINLPKIDGVLSKNIQQLSKEVLEKKIKEVQDLFSDDPNKQSVEKWFRFGKDVLKNTCEAHGKYCPICNSDISEKFDSILKDYYGYFDKSYETFIEELEQKTNNISKNITSLGKHEENAEKLEKTYIKYEKLLGNYSFDKYDFTNVKTDLCELEKSLKSKNDNIQSSFSKPNSIENNLIVLNNALPSFQRLKDNILKLLESKKLDTHKLEEQIRGTYFKIIILEFNQTNKLGALEKYKNNKDRISAIADSKEDGLPFFKSKLSEELKKIKVESRSISKYLSKMGIDHFDIDINEEKQDENIIIKYKNSLNGKNKLKNCLSDGEKTALAFAYFLSKFDNEINTETKVKEAVVVIDDPISSLDDNRLYSTAHLIWSNFKEVKQLIVLSHNFLFLKFFNSFYAGNATCLFLDQERICELPSELKNFETPYFFMLQELMNFLNTPILYTQCRKYLPNYTRRVLETFLSFKFAKIASTKNPNYCSGIEDFDDNINKTNLEKELKKDLIDRIKKIKSISEKFSHGNLQHTQENFYISENDLTTLVQNTIDVIETMDNLHKTCCVQN